MGEGWGGGEKPQLIELLRYLVIIFELKPRGLVRPITGWDMKQKEIRYYKKFKGKK